MKPLISLAMTSVVTSLAKYRSRQDTMLGVTTQKCADRRPSFCRIGAVRMNDGRVVIAIADAVNRNEMVRWFSSFSAFDYRRR